MKNVSLRQLRALVAVARTGSVTDAAKRLHVTPPAVTIQIKQLEADVGMSLLERTDQGFRPTEAGRQIVDAAAHVDAILTECAASVAALKGLQSGVVTLGAVSTAKYFAPQALAAFAQLHPAIEVRLVVGNRASIVSALEGYDIDLAIMGRPPEALEVESAVIGPHPHVVIAAPGHPLAARRGIAPRDLDHERFLLRERGSGTRALMERTFGKASRAARPGLDMGSNETIKQAVMAGLGIALISAHTVAAEISDARLAVLDVEGFPVERHWLIVKRKDRRSTPAVRAFWTFMESEGERFLPTAQGASNHKGRRAGQRRQSH